MVKVYAKGPRSKSFRKLSTYYGADPASAFYMAFIHMDPFLRCLNNS